MTLWQLFDSTPINFRKTMLLRLNIRNESVARNYRLGLLETYQAIQKKDRFRGYETLLVFMSEGERDAVYLGCYAIGDAKPLSAVTLSESYQDERLEQPDLVFYEMEKMHYLDELSNRLVIEWGSGVRNGLHKGTTYKEVLEIRPKR